MMDPRKEQQLSGRLRILARLLLLWAVVIAGRLIQLQVVQHKELRAQGDSQAHHKVEIPARRGSIFDRNHNALAMSLDSDSIAINPTRVPDVEVTASLMSSLLGVNREDLLDRIRSARIARKGFLYVKKRATAEDVERMRALKHDYIELRRESGRHYPKGFLASQIVGIVDQEQKGSAGIELSLEDELEGIPGAMRTTSDVRHRAFDSKIFNEPQPGKDITLTIDERIQFPAEVALKKAVESNHCKTGSIVVMRVGSAEILAMASYPTFNPNDAIEKGTSLSSRLNLAVSAPFEPGSVFKVITLAAALETTKLRPSSQVFCNNGALNLFGRVVHDHDPYGWLSMEDVLAKSSNIGAIRIGMQVGDATMYEFVKRFGFGRPTGIPLPAESAGRVRSLKSWSKSSIGSVAMGHELIASTIQLAQAFHAVANNGTLVAPKLILKKTRAGDADERPEAGPPARIFKPETAWELRKMMEAVVLRGTGKEAKLQGWSCGGKTGSAQIFDFDTHAYTHKYNASFAGMAPLTNPEIVVIVTLNGASQYGGAVAAPVFREIATTALRTLGVPKDRIENEKAPVLGPETPVRDLAVAGLAGNPLDDDQPQPAALIAQAPIAGPRVPNFRGKTMRAVLEESSEKGLPVVLTGSGVARKQVPGPGQVLGQGEKIRIQFVR